MSSKLIVKRATRCQPPRLGLIQIRRQKITESFLWPYRIDNVQASNWTFG
jgi:hypothetical protein